MEKGAKVTYKATPKHKNQENTEMLSKLKWKFGYEKKSRRERNCTPVAAGGVLLLVQSHTTIHTHSQRIHTFLFLPFLYSPSSSLNHILNLSKRYMGHFVTCCMWERSPSTPTSVLLSLSSCIWCPITTAYSISFFFFLRFSSLAPFHLRPAILKVTLQSYISICNCLSFCVCVCFC